MFLIPGEQALLDSYLPNLHRKPPDTDGRLSCAVRRDETKRDPGSCSWTPLTNPLTAIAARSQLILS